MSHIMVVALSESVQIPSLKTFKANGNDFVEYVCNSILNNLFLLKQFSLQP